MVATEDVAFHVYKQKGRPKRMIKVADANSLQRVCVCKHVAMKSRQALMRVKENTKGPKANFTRGDLYWQVERRRIVANAYSHSIALLLLLLLLLIQWITQLGREGGREREVHNHS